MGTRILPRLGVLAAVIALIAALGGCSASFSTSSVSSGEVEKQAQKAFDKEARKRGQSAFPPITCPDDLEEVEGATTHCFWKAEGEKFGIHVEVTSIEGSQVNMHFETEDESAK